MDKELLDFLQFHLEREISNWGIDITEDLFDEDNKYISKVDGREHLLIGKYKRRVKRLVGLKERAISPGDSLTVEATEAVQERVLNRSDDEDLLVKRYWFDGLGYQLTQPIQK